MPGRSAASNSPSASTTIGPFSRNSAISCCVFTSRASWVAGEESTNVRPALLQRQEPRCAQPVERDSTPVDAELPQSRDRLGREPVRVRDRVVVELPGVHRANIDAVDAMHRVRVLEQDRRALSGHDRAPCERAHRPDRHRDRAGRVPDVRLTEQQARLEAVCGHRRLQARESLGPERLGVDARVDHDPQGTQRGARHIRMR